MPPDDSAQEVTVVPPDETADQPESNPEVLEHPAKVMRIGAMVRNLLDEVRQSSLDDASRDRLKEIYETSLKELGEVLSPELRDELNRLSLPFEEGTPSQSELRVAHAQLVGWLEGLFHGIQAMLFAQQQENLARLEELRRRGLPSGGAAPDHGPGTYL